MDDTSGFGPAMAESAARERMDALEKSLRSLLHGYRELLRAVEWQTTKLAEIDRTLANVRDHLNRIDGRLTSLEVVTDFLKPTLEAPKNADQS